MEASTTPLHTLHAHSDEVARLMFSPDGKTLAACDDSMITFWDIATGSLRSKIEDQDDMFFEIAFSPDNRWIAAASFDGYGRIWSTTTGELGQTMSVDDERMLSLAFSPNSSLIATGSEVMRVWDVDTGELRHTLLGADDRSLSFAAVHERHEHPSEICQVLFSPDGNTLVSTCPDTSTVRLWSTATWELKQTVEGHEATFSPDGVHLAVRVKHSTTIQVYDTATLRLRSTIQSSDQSLSSPAFSLDSKILGTCLGSRIVLWDVESSKAVMTLEESQREMSALSFSPDGKVLVSGARKCGLIVWNVATGKCLLVLEHKDAIRDHSSNRGIRCGATAYEVSFMNGGGKVAFAFPDGSVRVWDIRWS